MLSNFQTLSNVDYYFLDTFFREQFSSEEALNLTQVHGLLTAVISAPTLIRPNEWTKVIFGLQPEFQNLIHLEKVMSLIIELYSQILRQLKGDEPYRLLLWDGKKSVPMERCSDAVLKSWCDGYLMGTKLDPLWGSDKSALAMLTPFSVLAQQHSFVGSEDSDGNLIEDDLAFISEYRLLLADFVQDNYAYWQQEREEGLLDKQYFSANDKKQKNRCPCGSQLNYKDCCYEESATLH